MNTQALTVAELDAAAQAALAVILAKAGVRLDENSRLLFECGFSAGCNYMIETLKEKGLL